MIKIEDLTGIPKWKRKRAIECLDDLLTFKDNKGYISPIITGYNWYAKIPQSNRIVTFSHIHETEEYRRAMFLDLEKVGYQKIGMEKCIRKKGGAFLWELDFQIRGEKGKLYPRLKIKDKETGRNLNLLKYPENTLENYPNLDGRLIGEDYGWELDLPFKDKKELMNIVELFIKKSDKGNEESWPGAYRVPLLLLGQKALDYKNDLPDFCKAMKISLKENENEICFVINKNFLRLSKLDNYSKLIKLGFKEELCLANNTFIRAYVDKKR